MYGKKINFKAKSIMIIALIITGISLGYVYLKTSGKRTSTMIVNFKLEEGVVLGVGDSLNPEERAEIMDYAIESVLEDEDIGNLLAGKEYSIEATIHGVQSVKDILHNSTLIRSETRVILEGRLVVTVTITYPDGSGYNVRVEIDDWSIGEPLYSEHVAPPTLMRDVIESALNRSRMLP